MYRPLFDRVIVKPIMEDEKTEGGIYIPSNAQEKPQRGEVVAVGPGRIEDGNLIDVCLTIGDKVVYGKYTGTEIKIDKEDYLIMSEKDVLAVIE